MVPRSVSWRVGWSDDWSPLLTRLTKPWWKRASLAWPPLPPVDSTWAAGCWSPPPDRPRNSKFEWCSPEFPPLDWT